MAAAGGGPTLKVKLGDWIECDEIVVEMIKHLQSTGEIGNGADFIEAELEGGIFVKKGVSDQIVDRIHAWIDRNAAPVDKTKPSAKSK